MAENIVLADVGAEVCEPVGGVEAVLSWANHADFESIVDPLDICGASSATTYAELVEIPTPGHVMLTGKKLFKVNFTTFTGSIKSTMVGENGRRLYDNEVSIRVDGSEAELLGFMRYIKNKKIMAFVAEVGSGNVRQFGSKRLPARCEVQEHTIEPTLDGGNSVTITFKDQQKWPAPIYKGILDYTTGV